MTICDGCDDILWCRPGIENTVTIDTTVTERMDTMKKVQISYELFMMLLRYHFLDDQECEEQIRCGLENKLDAMVMRDIYSKSKTALTEEEREKARQEYLDRRGIPDSFRW